MRHRLLWLSSLAFFAVLSTGCASFIGKKMAANLSQAILNQDDPDTVREGAPAYLLLIDSLVEGNPRAVDLLRAGARLYGAYAAAFVEDPERAKRLANKAYHYAQRQLCIGYPKQCDIRKQAYQEFKINVNAFTRADVPTLYSYATAWAIWVQAHSSDWAALAELPKVEEMLDRIVVLDEAYDQGQAHFYLGIIRSALPPSLGGKPDEGRRHFERMIKLSRGRNLMAKLEYAQRYARLVFDRELHDRLLRDVLLADPNVEGLTLSNTLAQQQAKHLLDSSADYFLE